MKLFRGDKIFNTNTKPNLYRSEGLRSKAFGANSDPANIERQGLIESIRRHIKPADSTDKLYYDVTDYLSFSESRDRAVYWGTDRGTLIFEDCDAYEETRYLFKLTIDDESLIKHGSGIYSLEFKCNPHLQTSIDKNFLLDAVFARNAQSRTCEICGGSSNGYHRIILINSYEYLNSN